jgi:hypothetical protein
MVGSASGKSSFVCTLLPNLINPIEVSLFAEVNETLVNLSQQVYGEGTI